MTLTEEDIDIVGCYGNEGYIGVTIKHYGSISVDAHILKRQILHALKLQESIKNEIKLGGRIELSPLALQSLVEESEK